MRGSTRDSRMCQVKFVIKFLLKFGANPIIKSDMNFEFALVMLIPVHFTYLAQSTVVSYELYLISKNILHWETAV